MTIVMYKVQLPILESNVIVSYCFLACEERYCNSQPMEMELQYKG